MGEKTKKTLRARLLANHPDADRSCRRCEREGRVPFPYRRMPTLAAHYRLEHTEWIEDNPKKWAAWLVEWGCE